MAAVIAPKTISPDRWLSEILAAAIAVLDPESVERFVELVMMRANAALDQAWDRDYFADTLAKRSKGAMGEWAAGFSHGHGTFGSSWPARFTAADDRAMIKLIAERTETGFSPEDTRTLGQRIEARRARNLR